MMRAICVMTVCTAATLAASPYCAFEINVRSPAGSPSVDAQVEMVSNGNPPVVAVSDKQGIARFCDAPVRPVDFAIGTRDCGVILVRGLRLTWPKTRKVFVTYDRTHCGGELIFPTSCLILLRIADDEGRPLAGAELDSGPSERHVSDPFGRIFRLIMAGEDLMGVVKKEGYEPAHVLEHCVRNDERDIEPSVVLYKEGR